MSKKKTVLLMGSDEMFEYNFLKAVGVFADLAVSFRYALYKLRGHFALQ